MIGSGNHLYVMTRLGRWKIWANWGTRPGPRRVVASMGKLLGPTEGEELGRCPYEDEAIETKECIDALEVSLRNVIIQCYLFGGTTLQKAQRLGCDKRTYHRRLERAYVKLLDLFNAAAADLPLD